MKLSSLLKPELISPNIISDNLEDLFSKTVDALYSNGYIEDRKLIYSKLFEREKLGSTALGNNAAIPHAKINGLDQTIVFLAISRDGIAYNKENENKLVNLIIFILSPINSPVSHLQTLAAAASLIKNCPGFIKDTSSLNPEEILDYLKIKEAEYDQ